VRLTWSCNDWIIEVVEDEYIMTEAGGMGRRVATSYTMASCLFKVINKLVRAVWAMPAENLARSGKIPLSHAGSRIGRRKGGASDDDRTVVLGEAARMSGRVETAYRLQVCHRGEDSLQPNAGVRRATQG
jgi:hypothetical protein